MLCKYSLINLPFIFFFGRPRPFLGACSEGNSSRKVLDETFKAKVGFEAKIDIIAKAKVGIGKFLTASRNANNNIEGLDIKNFSRIENVNIALNLLAFFTICKKPK